MTGPGGTPAQPGAPDGGAGDPSGVIRASYAELLGGIPPGIEDRLALAARAGRTDAVEAIESLRRALVMDNPLGRRAGQLVHFGQLLALGKGGPARLHARAARRAGASLAQLLGVAKLALITASMPAYSLGVEILTELAREDPGAASRSGAGPA